MKVVPVPVLEDNYAYLIIDEASKISLFVDPAEPTKLLNAAREHEVEPKSVLTTHKHWDHAGGNLELSKLCPGLDFVGSEEDAIPSMTHPVRDGDTFQVGGLSIRTFVTPCHTRGHVLYLVSDSSKPNQPASLFTGDTLFVSGCGRFFEGTAKEMHHALNEVIASLPAETFIYCGHEYTVNNLLFALHIEPKNEDMQKKLAWAKETVQQGRFTVPSTVAEEKLCNPFMRVNQPSVAEVLGLPSSDPVKIMGELRHRKDSFKSKPAL
mmetsp:Transcript_25984/g.44703  ORF Transcript_25984/g.44703 Transcript_25984/m.44703 type:complete len:266 (-) Transcript_25984:246-1043(-)|eukprot:CAMPEP_0196653532 /NCGR_PEP_ID=MMETSP1086-20130531/3173_1 /TAXON_ID=77921 /ORGANISM="Cyanoptyche  gloeocystis , Strain SAG4.97" /LENGTH=265 /DNA_ID=CAMNT_0041984791 /DNA_START=66 /DNA_END=863 /DNA_ORIENTATION=+